MDEPEVQQRVVKQDKNTKFLIKLVGGAIFAAISLVVSLLTTAYLPRVQWGLALIDPVSIVWILSFFIFGYEAGIITSILGMFLLMPFDAFAPVGEIMKFTATIPLIMIPWIMDKLRKQAHTSESVLLKKNLMINWIIAVVVRVVLMILLNYLVMITIYSAFFDPNVQTLEFLGLPVITGWTAIIITVIVLNVLQSVWDYFISYGVTLLVRAGQELPW
jgi:riboflavin transporter FmnP